MTKSIPIDQKLGCDKHGVDNAILIKASVAEVSWVIQEYFGLEVRSCCQLAEYIASWKASWEEIERQRQVRKSRPEKSCPPIVWATPFWQYLNHQWVFLPLSGTQDAIAFAFASLLNTDVITFHDSDNVSLTEFKVFRSDRLIEHYLYGDESGKPIDHYWDISTSFEYFGDRPDPHYFKSAVRQVTESEIREALAARKQDNRGDRGFVDACLKYYGAYIPLLEETPYHYYGNWNTNYQDWDAIVERMDMMLVPSNWKYADRIVPNQVR
ncbi:MAG: hypothetical protein SFY66_02665 [Oculatellaceae cyanobacterium bins.114]|nr:hypothetical protein [Oculatellaceae cyanobacterium bins.114]